MAIVYGDITLKAHPDVSIANGYFQSEAAFVQWCVYKWGVGVLDSQCEVCVCHWRNGRLEMGDTFCDISSRVHEYYHDAVARMAARSHS